MARNRNPKRDEALKIFVDRNGEVSNRELASFLSVPEKTISAWKSRDKWNAVLQKDKCSTANDDCSTTKKKGAPAGNQNAKGNKGNSRASPPLDNKNAVKTGEYETIFADTLTDEEKEIYSTMSDDPSFILAEEIRLLKIRQLRMLQRIKEAQNDLTDEEVEYLQELRNFTKPVERNGVKAEIKEKRLTDVQVTRKRFRKIDTILSIEEALTRVSNQLTRTIKQLNDIDLTEKRMALIDKQIVRNEAQTDYTKAQTTRALINKDGDENDGGTVINIIDDIG